MGRHRLREYRRRWVHDDALGWLDIVEEIVTDPVQDDLTADDVLVEQTEKGDDGADAAEFGEISQDPSWIPSTVIEADGRDWR